MNPHTLADYVVAAEAGLDPDVQTAGAKTGAVVDCQGHQKTLWSVLLGTLGSSATVNFKVQDSATSGGSYGDVPNAAIAEQTQAGTDASDSLVDLEVDVRPGKPFQKGILTIGVATSDAGACVHLFHPRQK